MASALSSITTSPAVATLPNTVLGGEHLLDVGGIPPTLPGMLTWAGINNRYRIEPNLKDIVLIRREVRSHCLVFVTGVPLRLGDPDGPAPEYRDPADAGRQVRETAHVSDALRLLHGLGLRPLVMQEVASAITALSPIIVDSITMGDTGGSVLFPVECGDGVVRYLALSVSPNLRFLYLLDARRARLRASDRIVGLMR